MPRNGPVRFGKGRLETRVMLCAGRLLHLVVLHPTLEVIERAKQVVAEWLSHMGLELKPSKTRITHTLQPYENQVGFDFLGATIRQFPVGKTHSGKTRGKTPKLLGFKTLIRPSRAALHKHLVKTKEVIRKHRAHSQTD